MPVVSRIPFSLGMNSRRKALGGGGTFPLFEEDLSDWTCQPPVDVSLSYPSVPGWRTFCSIQSPRLPDLSLTPLRQAPLPHAPHWCSRYPFDRIFPPGGAVCKRCSRPSRDFAEVNPPTCGAASRLDLTRKIPFCLSASRRPSQ